MNEDQISTPAASPSSPSEEPAPPSPAPSPAPSHEPDSPRLRAWACSTSLGHFGLALAKAQGLMMPPSKDHQATIPGKEGKAGYAYHYSDLASVLEAVRAPLSTNGLAHLQIPSVLRNGERVAVSLTTLLVHAGSGEWLRAELVLPVGVTTPQGIGSAITYARRYALMAMLGIAPEDDDGAEASREEPRGQRDDRRQEPAAKAAKDKPAAAAAPKDAKPPTVEELVAKLSPAELATWKELEPRFKECHDNQVTMTALSAVWHAAKDAFPKATDVWTALYKLRANQASNAIKARVDAASAAGPTGTSAPTASSGPTGAGGATGIIK